MPELEALSEAIIVGNAGKAKELTESALASGVRAMDVVMQGLLPGMSVVGARFKRKW